jgi:hypothetical protein
LFSGICSHYSRHTAAFDKHLEIHPKIGYTFRLGDFTVTPEAGFLPVRSPGMAWYLNAGYEGVFPGQLFRLKKHSGRQRSACTLGISIFPGES